MNSIFGGILIRPQYFPNFWIVSFFGWYNVHSSLKHCI
jgi:hypothetical protein